MSFSHKIDACFLIFILKEDQTESELAFGSENVLRAKFNFKEDQNVLEMLMSFFIVNSVNHWVVIVLN